MKARIMKNASAIFLKEKFKQTDSLPIADYYWAYTLRKLEGKVLTVRRADENTIVVGDGVGYEVARNLVELIDEEPVSA